MTQATAEQIREGVIAAITSEPVANERWREMSHDGLRAQGYVIGIGNQKEGEYRGDPCKFPSLNPSTAKIMVLECADDAWRQHPKGGAVSAESSAAMDEGNLYDQLLTGEQEEDNEDLELITSGADIAQATATHEWMRANKQKKGVEIVTYTDVAKFRVIDVDDFRPAIAREVAADARANRLIPIKRKAFEKAKETAAELRVRMELAGVDMSTGARQVPVYWVEFSDDGTPVQCRGMLDQLTGNTVRDLKKTQSLRLDAIGRTVWNFGYDIQAVGYTRALEFITGETHRFEWAFIRSGKLPAVRKVPIGFSMMECGRARWRHAVNEWAKCLKAGFWPGYELANHELEAEPFMLMRVEQLLMANDGE